MDSLHTVSIFCNQLQSYFICNFIAFFNKIKDVHILEYTMDAFLLKEINLNR